jgi:hypothetical protein
MHSHGFILAKQHLITSNLMFVLEVLALGCAVIIVVTVFPEIPEEWQRVTGSKKKKKFKYVAGHGV